MEAAGTGGKPAESGGAGLYVHIPFCSRICPYCDFAVLTGGRERRRRFVGALLAEIAMAGRASGPPEDAAGSPAEPAGPGAPAPWRELDTVYFGGGTPSILDPAELAEVLAAARAALPLAPDPWIFLEANPEDVSAESLNRWRELGVRTLSLGVQAFDAAALSFLGRRHGPEQARRSVALAGRAGFRTVAIDLIYGLPGDTLERWRQNLEGALALSPDHLSCYQLTVHEGTPFGFRAARGGLCELPEEAQAELFAFTHRFLNDHGYQGYEVSSFARGPEHRSRHNRKYWDHSPYLGLGPSAHSFDGLRRWWNERKLPRYEAVVAGGKRPVAGCEALGPDELALEALMLGLRTYEGIDLARFRERFGLDLASRNRRLLARFAEEGLVEPRREALVPTLAGLAVADSLARRLEVA